MRLIIFLSILLVSLKGFTQEAGKSTDEILSQAYAQAGKEKKNVFVIFHASWCGWCHKMDTAMNDASVKPFFDKSYVVRHLVVHESAKNKALETPGAEPLMNKYGGKDSGIPYWLIFDKEGKLLADSQRLPGGNVGCPANKEEVDHFITALKKSSSITAAETAAVEKRFRKNEQ
jgi:thioredoxin-related protein